MRAPARFPIVLTLMSAAVLALLLTLGVWQSQRLQWKQGLIARAEAAAQRPPVPLSEALTEAKKGADPEFRRVVLTCRGLGAAAFVELQTIEDGDAGVRLISACPVEGQGPDQGVVLVDRGFVAAETPERPAVNEADSMPVVVAGVLRRAPAPGAMTPPPSGRQFFGRDMAAMAKALNVAGPVSPFTVYAVTSTNPDWPALRPVAPPPAFSNNHLGYALTWFGLAAVLIVFYVVLLRRRLRRANSPEDR